MMGIANPLFEAGGLQIRWNREHSICLIIKTLIKNPNKSEPIFS